MNDSHKTQLWLFNFVQTTWQSALCCLISFHHTELRRQKERFEQEREWRYKSDNMIECIGTIGVCVYYDLTTLRLSEPNHNSLHSKWVRTVYRVNGIRCFCLIKMLKAVTAAAPPPVETVTTPAPVYGSHNNNKDQRSRIIQVKKKTRTKKNWSKSRNTGCMNNTTIPKILCMVHFPPTVNSLLYS